MKWLVAGALAAALTYSGTAAIHACLLVWDGQLRGELDFYALLAILSTSCLITVPLINWSNALRKLGSQDPSEVGIRTVIIYWGFLVTLGLLAALSQLWIFAPEWDAWFNYSNSTNITCASPKSQIAYAVGQDPSWGIFVVDVEFIQENGCVDPCQQTLFEYPVALFRRLSDLQLLSLNEYNSSNVLNGGFFNFYLYLGGIMAIVILSQGLWALVAGSNHKNPRECRGIIYSFFRDLRLPISGCEGGERWQKRAAKYVAIFAYLWAVLASILCVTLFLFNIAAMEYLLANLPEAESARHIGAWGPWVGTGLAILAALVAKFHTTVVDKASASLVRAISWGVGRSREGYDGNGRGRNPAYQRSKQSRCTKMGSGLPGYYGEHRDQWGSCPLGLIKWMAMSVTSSARNEWASLTAFWRDPDNEITNAQQQPGETYGSYVLFVMTFLLLSSTKTLEAVHSQSMV